MAEDSDWENAFNSETPHPYDIETAQLSDGNDGGFADDDDLFDAIIKDTGDDFWDLSVRDTASPMRLPSSKPGNTFLHEDSRTTITLDLVDNNENGPSPTPQPYVPHPSLITATTPSDYRHLLEHSALSSCSSTSLHLSETEGTNCPSLATTPTQYLSGCASLPATLDARRKNTDDVNYPRSAPPQRAKSSGNVRCLSTRSVWENAAALMESPVSGTGHHVELSTLRLRSSVSDMFDQDQLD